MSCTMQITLRSIIKLHPFGTLTATRSAELKSDLDLLNLHRYLNSVFYLGKPGPSTGVDKSVSVN